MRAGGSLRELATFLDACEEESRVSGVELGGVDAAPDGLTADVELVLAAAPGGTGFEASIDDDGVLRLAFETAGAVVPTTGHDVVVEPSTVAVDADGNVTVTLSATVPTREGDAGDADVDDGASGERETVEAGDVTSGSVEAGSVTATTGADGGAGAGGGGVTAAATDGGDGAVAAAGGGTARPSGDAASTGPDADDAPAFERSASDVPPFEDRELLQEVYEAHDTFAEMPAALGMDVTAETVRRYMIDFGIHEPRTYDTSGEADGDAGDGEADGGGAGGPEVDDREAGGEEATLDDAADGGVGGPASEEAPVVLADGVGLPDDVTVDAIVATVRESNTIYEVTRDIGVDREAALELLRELDLLEFVVGRLATEAERSIERETVVERLRQHADAQ